MGPGRPLLVLGSVVSGLARGPVALWAGPVRLCVLKRLRDPSVWKSPAGFVVTDASSSRFQRQLSREAFPSRRASRSSTA
ncbi:hypothetical protein ARTHRO8AJ_300008 [Arthrobacter sp. 8AJ]|nr:hypothetical protein ARTHRO8AJ_300008 [Arthrobacter sp. 8AJ]